MAEGARRRAGRRGSGETNVSEGVVCALPPGGSPRVSPLGCQPELDTVITALASALSRACGPPAGTSRKVCGPWPQPSCVCRAALPTARPLGTHQMRMRVCTHRHTHTRAHTGTHAHTCTFVLAHTGTCTHRYIHHTLIHTPGPHALQEAKQSVKGTADTEDLCSGTPPGTPQCNSGTCPRGSRGP